MCVATDFAGLVCLVYQTDSFSLSLVSSIGGRARGCRGGRIRLRVRAPPSLTVSRRPTSGAAVFQVALAEDTNVRAVVLHGEGRAFCAGSRPNGVRLNEEHLCVL